MRRQVPENTGWYPQQEDPMNQAEIGNRFTHHPPGSPAVADAHANVRRIALYVAEQWNGLLPESREKSLAFTALEEALMWANAAIARNQP
jgi:hypothetical protein